VSGEEVASRAQSRRPYASGREPSVTGSLGARKSTMHKREDDEYIDE